MSKFRGFSLIELLVVISIMAILISLSAFGLQQARESARDGQRKSDLETIRTGLSFYKADCNRYPIDETGDDFKTLYGDSFTGNDGACGNSNSYINKTPADPVSGRDYHYLSNDVGTTYTLCAYLESGSGSTAAGCPSSGCGGVCNYAVYNP